MSNPPKKVKVGSSMFELLVVDKYPEDLGIDPTYGATDCVTERMYIKRGQSEGQMRDTALHEVLHAIFNRAGINISDLEEEATISRVVPWLLLLIQDNPKLVAYLQEKVR